MAEPIALSTGFRVYLGVAAVAAFGYACCYLFWPLTYFAWVQWPWRDLAMTGLFGVTLVSLALGAVLCLRARTWSEVRLFVGFTTIWFGLVCVWDVYTVFGLDMPEPALPGVYADTAVNLLLGAGCAWFYARHERAQAAASRAA